MKQNKIPASLKNVSLNGVYKRSAIFAKQKQNQALKELAKEVLKTKKKGVKAAPPPRSPYFTNETIDGYWQKQIRVVDIVEHEFENTLGQYIRYVKDEFLKHLDEEVSRRKHLKKFMQKDFFEDNRKRLMTKARLDFSPLLENLAVVAGNEANKLIGVDDPYLPFNYRGQIERNVTKFTKSMLDTDRDKIVDIINEGIKDGRSVPDIRSAIVEDFDDYSKMQAERITRTEVLRTSNQAALDAFEQSGVVEGKQWVTYGAVDECAEFDGEIVGLRSSFYGDTDQFRDGDPPLHPNCRCIVIPIVEKAEKTYIPDSKALREKVAELEGQVDKRTKAYKELKKTYQDEKADDKAYIKALEKHLGVDDEQE